MNKKLSTSIVLLLFVCGLLYFGKPAIHTRLSVIEYERRIGAIARESCGKKSGKKEIATDQPDMAALQEFLMTMDPATGTVPRERLLKAYNQTRALSQLKNSNDFQWKGYGVEMGGRTRMLMFDPNDGTQKKVWAGGITGGLWYNQDITSASSSWIPVGDFWSNLSVRCMAYDPNNTQVFYIGTGEAETALQTYRESSGLGIGIWKSTDGGQSWNQLSSSQAFCYITKIIVRSENGSSIIYAGVASGLYHGIHQSQPTDGLFRSADGGSSWQQVLPNIIGTTVPYAVEDIALSAGGRILVGTRPNLDGQGGATILYSDAGTAGSWTINESYEQEILGLSNFNIPGRVVLAAAPSDANVVYALIAGGNIDPASNFNRFYCIDILRSADKGVTWTKKNMPLYNDTLNFAYIAWHALDIAVDPNNPNLIYAGGLDMHRSTDGGNNWTKLSDWSLMYSGGGDQYIHADQHTIVYKPGSSGELIFGCDGGVFYTANGNAASPKFEQHNHNYNTLQFYTCDLSPTAGQNLFIGGLQDNGSLYYTGTPLTIYSMVVGGDGAFCFWDKNEPRYFMASYYYNHYSFFDNGSWLGSNTGQSGIFLNPADLDYKLNLLYANATDFTGTVLPNQLLVVSGLYSASPVESFINLNTGLNVYYSAVTYSSYSPAGKSTLFVGSVSGNLYKVLEAQSGFPQVTEITGSNFPSGNIACIALGGSEDTLMAIFSNYGVSSVWTTNNGGVTWADKEGNLPDMPVRWGMFFPGNSNSALIATETGVWGTGNLGASTVLWTPYNTGMANVRTDMLKYRASDHTVLAATQGRGLFTTSWDFPVGTKEIQQTDINVFPNPSTGRFSITASGLVMQNVAITISNLTGQTVDSRTAFTNSGKLEQSFDLSTAPKGVYILRMTSGKNILGEKKILIR
jgi:photosystem II stability/assembly factor-like uncharacterized protein